MRMDRHPPLPTPARWSEGVIARGWVVPLACRPQQTALLRKRLRTLGPVIAMLVLAWIPLDLVGLHRTELAWILPLRLALALSLLLLVRICLQLSALVATMSFVWLQAIAFGAMQLCLEPAHGSALRGSYSLFPFLLTAQLAVLPLPWGCTLRAALAALALLFAPVLLGDRPFGAALWNDLWLFGLILSLAAWASHSQLALLIDLLGARRDASHDALTGLANRRSAEQRLEADRTHALRHGEPLSVLMIDLDRFKEVNDRWGHAGGDLVLVATAQVLREELRGADLGARHGGEEFLAILPATAPVAAMDVADRIRERIARLAVPVSGGTVTITASIGVATMQPAESAAALIERADLALYRAKVAGRNRCADAVNVDGDPVRPQSPDACAGAGRD